MFKAPFSFEGRIRRTEYGLTLIIYAAAILLVNLIVASIFISSVNEGGTFGSTAAVIVYLLSLVPMLWFLWAQGAKRAHDVGHSGWYQLIPFYFLYLLFADGNHGPNGYGENPKGIGNEMFTFSDVPQNNYQPSEHSESNVN